MLVLITECTLCNERIQELYESHAVGVDDVFYVVVIDLVLVVDDDAVAVI